MNQHHHTDKHLASKQPQISSMYNTAKRASRPDLGDNSIHLSKDIIELGKVKRVAIEPETAESTKKSLRPVVGKRINEAP